MDLHAFWKNIETAARTCPTILDGAKRLAWSYAHDSGPGALLPRSHTIRFRYPEPIGDLALHVRSNRGSDLYIFSEVFEHRYYDFTLPFVPRTILDVGANIGLTTIFLARKYPNAEVASVEPVPSNVAVLRTNLRLNHVNAQVFDVAVAATDGPVAMELMNQDYGHRITAVGAVVNQISVPGLSISTLLARLGWDRVNLLKVDIEGYEAVLFNEHADWLQRTDAISIEWHDHATRHVLEQAASRYGFSPPITLPGTTLLFRGDGTRS